MTKYTIEESTLTGIADAIRGKVGERTFKPREMAAAIESIEGKDLDCNGLHMPDSVEISGTCTYLFNNDRFKWMIDAIGDKITTKDIDNANNMFSQSTLNKVPFDINLKSSSNPSCNSLFFNMAKLSEPSYVIGTAGDIGMIFGNCYCLKEIPEDWASKIDWTRLHSYNYAGMNSVFYYCYSLRAIPQSLIDNLWGIHKSSSSSPTSRTFFYCHVLEEVNSFPLHKASPLTSNMFTDTLVGAHRLKNFTFATQDGEPYEVNWSKQFIGLYNGVGFSSGYSESDSVKRITGYNSGITEATRIVDDATYEQFKNHPDSWTTLPEYSRYNKQSAINTINSLPDASQGSENTIKFKGDAGSKTDGGAINTLTSEEIAIAASRGWTISFV